MNNATIVVLSSLISWTKSNQHARVPTGLKSLDSIVTFINECHYPLVGWFIPVIVSTWSSSDLMESRETVIYFWLFLIFLYLLLLLLLLFQFLLLLLLLLKVSASDGDGDIVNISCIEIVLVVRWLLTAFEASEKYDLEDVCFFKVVVAVAVVLLLLFSTKIFLFLFFYFVELEWLGCLLLLLLLLVMLLVLLVL